MRGRCVWGDRENDGMYDVCFVGCDVPMWVEIDGAMLFMRAMLWYSLCGGDIGT